MRIAVDIDGVLTEDIEGHDYKNRFPNMNNIRRVNHLFDKEHTIILYTARYWRDWWVTKAWLQKYGVKYHKLVMRKLKYDYIADDKARSLIFLIKKVKDERRRY